MATRFEQSIDIVPGIQRILREYPFGETILFELLQNADDFHAVLIEGPRSGQRGEAMSMSSDRDHRDPRGWSSWLTDAGYSSLYAYNSGLFSEGDLKNIQKINGSSEHSSIATTSRVSILNW